MFPTRHAVERFQQRVAAVSTAEAFRQLQSAASTARVRATPRWWTPVKPAAGLLFLYPASLPGVCLLVRDGAILTVYQRSQCQAWRVARPRQRPPAPARRHPYRRPAVGGPLEEAA
ncbi:hypothetical protein [Pseudonocardia alni]|uniref:hypothetical protein n=1 Tax=Pseudonocardia alni TaxID=33907 RepID=UPI002799F2FE|nr:hypothetical protein PaSha_18765 [Pseudonocardia alni]